MHVLFLVSAILAHAQGQIFGNWGNEGTLMYVAFPYNDGGSTAGRNDIMITGPEGTGVNITALNPAVHLQRTIGASGIIRELLSGDARITATPPSASNKAVRISATAPVTVHVGNAVDGTPGGYMAFPARSDDVEFVAASYTALSTRHSLITIIGTEANTDVDVYAPDGSFQRIFSLYEFETYTLGSLSIDYTGYYINSTKPIAVVSGHECANVPTVVNYCDHMAAQIPAITNLHDLMIVPPIAGRRANTTGYRVRVIGAYNDTTVTVYHYNNENTVVLNRGDFEEVDITPTVSSTTVSCNRPCLVTYYNKGGIADHSRTDPFMGLVLGMSHFSSNVTFGTARRHDNSQFSNHLAIVAVDSVTDNLLLNGAPLNAPWAPVFAVPGVSWTTIPIPDGGHSLEADTSTPGYYFAAYVYGHSQSNEEAYSYPAGAGFADGEHPSTTSTTGSPTPSTSVGPTEWPPGTRRPILEVMVNTTYRTEDDSILSGPCVTLYSDTLSTRNIQMALYISVELLGQSMCPGFQGTSILTADVTLINIGNNGIATLGMWLPGYFDRTFTEMHECGWEISTYLQDMDNWGRPIIGQEPGCPALIFDDRFDHFDWRWKCNLWNE